MIKHIILTKFTDPETAVPEASRRLLALKDKIPQIVDMEVGADFLHSSRSYDMGLIVTFRTREDLAVYADHPDHALVKEYIHAHREGTVSVDFEY